MNFKFRPPTDNHPNPNPNFFPPPRNPDMSFFTQQAIRVGIRGGGPTGREYGYPAGPVMEMRGSIERELEKERIRAEIIAEEIIRRRVLEQEVRREMMMEREMAFRTRHGGVGGGFGVGAPMPMRQPLLTNFEHPGGRGGAVVDGVSPLREAGFRDRFRAVPFQRDPVVATGSSGSVRLQEIKEVKGVVAPSSDVKEEKVIILAKPSSNLADIKRKAMAPAASGVVEVLKKQKSNEDWSCALCRISATSQQGLNEHLQGKKHKARERGMVTQRTGFGTTPLPKTSNTNTSKCTKAPSLTSSPSFGKGGDTDGESSTFGTVDNPTTQKTLEVKNNPFSLNEPSVEKKSSGVAKAQGNAKLRKKFRHFCEVCEVGANDLRVFKSHLKGKRHLTKLSEVNKSDEAAAGKASTQQGVVENKAPVASEEIKEASEGEHAATDNHSANGDVDIVEDVNKVSETPADANIASKSTEPASVCNAVSAFAI